MAEDKTNQIINNYLTYAEKHITEHGKEFSSFNTIYQKFIKKSNIDPAFEYTKEIVKRMEKDKLTSPQSMQIAEVLMPKMKEMRKKVILMLLPLIVGILIIIIFSILAGFARPFNMSNPFLVGYTIASLLGLISLIVGLFLRKKIKLVTLSNMMLFQAVTAYSAAKMQGQGTFAALRILEEIKANPNKELQIRINKPKIIYK